jgi:16S rRNA (adenine1518-N6/adenine1519-N6)-dimethyltransferase
MNLTSPKDVKDWCRANGFHPSRAMGQNFLIDRNTLDAIITTSGAAAGQRILEIGPGLGVLTQALLEAGASVTAVEKDHRLAKWLREFLSPRFHDRLAIIEGDMLKQNLDELLSVRFDSTISNLPYSVGTRILVDLALHPLAPETFTLLLQTEVAERIIAPESHPERALLSVWIQRLYDIRTAQKIPPTCFYPRPEVDSTLIHLTRHNRHPLSSWQAAAFATTTRHAFTHRRKQLLPLLRSLKKISGDALQRIFSNLGLDPKIRPEELDVAAWCGLAAEWAKHDS